MVSNIILTAYTWVQAVRTSAVEALKPEDGQDIMEYAVIVGAIALVTAAFLGFGGNTILTDALTNFADEIGQCISFDEACGPA